MILLGQFLVRLRLFESVRGSLAGEGGRTDTNCVQSQRMYALLQRYMVIVVAAGAKRMVMLVLRE